MMDVCASSKYSENGRRRSANFWRALEEKDKNSKAKKGGRPKKKKKNEVSAKEKTSDVLDANLLIRTSSCLSLFSDLG